MNGLRILVAAGFIVALSTSACMARSSYLASNWNDLIAKVSCKDVTQRSSGEWQISANVSFAGSLKADPVVPDEDVDALKKRCPAAGAH